MPTVLIDTTEIPVADATLFLYTSPTPGFVDPTAREAVTVGDGVVQLISARAGHRPRVVVASVAQGEVPWAPWSEADLLADVEVEVAGPTLALVGLYGEGLVEVPWSLPAAPRQVRVFRVGADGVQALDEPLLAGTVGVEQWLVLVSE